MDWLSMLAIVFVVLFAVLMGDREVSQPRTMQDAVGIYLCARTDESLGVNNSIL